MDQNYSINEILLAVDEIQNKKKKEKTVSVKIKSIQNDFSEVPKNTLKLIEDAEKNKN